jgi:hypothetical protein
MKRPNTYVVATRGVIVGANLDSEFVDLPLNSAGERPYAIRIVSTVPAYVKVGGAADSAEVGDTLVQPGDGIELAVPRSAAVTKIFAKKVFATGPDGIVQITAIED